MEPVVWFVTLHFQARDFSYQHIMLDYMVPRDWVRINLEGFTTLSIMAVNRDQAVKAARAVIESENITVSHIVLTLSGSPGRSLFGQDVMTFLAAENRV